MGATGGNWIGFGLERLGIAALRAPRAALAVLVVLTLASTFGITRVQFDNEIRESFATVEEGSFQLPEMARGFADSERDLTVLVRTQDFADLAALERLRDLQFELRFLDGIATVSSVFDLRRPAEGDTPPAPVLGAGLAEAALPGLFAEIDTHPLSSGAFLSRDRTASLIIVVPDEDHREQATLARFIDEIDAIAEPFEADGLLEVTVTGVPAIRQSIITALIQDAVVLNVAGALLTTLLALILFRSLAAALVSTLPGFIASSWVLGFQGLFGVPVNVMTNVIPMLILIVTFADSMHLTYGWMRRERATGSVAGDLAANVREIGPACGLASLTTAVAFAAIAISDTILVRRFGVTGAISVLAAFSVMITLQPVLCLTILRDPNRRRTSIRYTLAGLSLWIDRVVSAAPRRIVALGGIVTVASGAAFFSLPSDYQIRETLSLEHPVNHALGVIDSELGGAYAIQFAYPLPVPAAPFSRESLEPVRELHRALEAANEGETVRSLWNIAVWHGGGTMPDEESLASLWEEFPENQRRQFISADGARHQLSAFVGEVPSAVLLARAERLRQALEATTAGKGAQPLGILHYTAERSLKVLDDLIFGLMMAIILAIGLVTIAFRSPRLGAGSVVPNVLPILVTGAWLWLSGQPLQYASTMALTIAFGIAVNDTVHLLNRYRLGRGAGEGREASTHVAIRETGPVMIAATAILCAGLLPTMFSSLPPVPIFGTLCIILLGTALVADLFLLPAILLVFRPSKRTAS